VEGGRLDGSGDAASLAEAILQPLQDPELALRWGEAARAVFDREFTSTRMARETAAVYDEMLARTPSR
jgi:glycosyltransferase involved in cell wall biosynthesis